MSSKARNNIKKSIFIYFKHFAYAEILRFTDRLWMITRQSTFQAYRGFSRFLRVWLWCGRLLISYKGNALKVWESSCSFATPLISFGHFFIFQDVYMCGGMRKHSTSDSRQPKDFFFPASLDLSLLKCKYGGFCRFNKKRHTLDNLARTHTYPRTHMSACASLRSQLTYECKFNNKGLFVSLTMFHFF